MYFNGGFFFYASWPAYLKIGPSFLNVLQELNQIKPVYILQQNSQGHKLS